MDRMNLYRCPHCDTPPDLRENWEQVPGAKFYCGCPVLTCFEHEKKAERKGAMSATAARADWNFYVRHSSDFVRPAKKPTYTQLDSMYKTEQERREALARAMRKAMAQAKRSNPGWLDTIQKALDQFDNDAVEPSSPTAQRARSAS